MKIQTVQRGFALGLSLLWIGSLGVSRVQADSISRHRPTVRISVYNDAGLKRGTLLRAEENALEVFRQAGIETEWKNCGGEELVTQSDKPCGEVAYPARLVLRIERRPRGLITEPLGVAYLSENGEGAYCDVFLEPMEELQRLQAVSLDAVLGHVAAHEIGHLLLGMHAHSVNGLMRASWSSQSIEALKRGALGFNPRQSAAMVDRLQFAQVTGKDALVTMAEAATEALSALPVQCPNSH
jgi:hypothetical protein